jgi:putative pyruvate formate lyase activating enzyme
VTAQNVMNPYAERIGYSPACRSKMTVAQLERLAAELKELMRECSLCPHECHARRLDGKYGVCRSTADAVISSAGPHYGEEPPLTGSRGSGTIFFTSCNLKCTFCQNYDISQMRLGRQVSTQELAGIMLRLQQSGCHNINLVTPTHMVPQWVEALTCAVKDGLALPIVYNCGGYESVKVLELLEGIVDIYMPDIKYADNGIARKYSGAPGYWDIVRPAVKEMHRQVGDLVVDANGIARKGLLIRHLVLPNDLAGSRAVLDFIARDVSPSTYVNIMDQYRPAYRALRYYELSRMIKESEYHEALEYASTVGLRRGFSFNSALGH